MGRVPVNMCEALGSIPTAPELGGQGSKFCEPHKLPWHAKC